MTDKPEVVAYGWEHRGRHACVDPAYAAQLMGDGEQVYALIRLTDHERLQAEAERLQADHEAARAADKARIKLLEAALNHVRKELGIDWLHPCFDAARDALSQQGKE